MLLINIIRKTKASFLRFKLHKIFGPFAGFYSLLSYITRLSKWVSENGKNIKFNDFYLSKFNPSKRFELYKYILDSEKLGCNIDYLEFGVAEGHTMRWWLSNNKDNNSRFFGFDTFEGLPEDWGPLKKGTFSSQGKKPELPEDSRCNLVEGLFQQTLPGFLKAFNGTNRKVINMDADLYSSTLYVLTSIAPFLKKDDVIIFDEFNVPLHEFRAFTDFFSSYMIDYEILGAVNNYFHLALKIK